MIKYATFYSGKMKDQTKYGISSDGQLIYLTGLIPLTSDATIFKCKRNTFKAIPNLLLGYTTKTIIPTHDDCWSQKDINVKYGIHKMISLDNSAIIQSNCCDESIFKEALNSDINCQQPFFSMILTISTHLPYKTPYLNEKINFPKNFSNELKNYLLNVKYMDKYIGLYINNLKSKGLFDNSVIVIVGDHLPPRSSLDMSNYNLCNMLPFIIINGGVNIINDDLLSQDCVFPTILDLMGINSNYRGVGQSLLMPNIQRDNKFEQTRMKLKHDISSMILRTNFFNERNGF